jgi:hypothetical protein
MGDAHVIRHYINHQAHGLLFQALGEGSEFFCGADFRIETSVVGNVVPVHAPGMSHQKWRGVTVGDTEVMKIVNDRGSLTESEGQIQLEAVSGAGDVGRFSRSSVLQCYASVTLRC